eukprot:CAMPEP_0197651106 /NCGR_PEP_ID=MMETSP1338-20131121/31354_1 /TAXON_ID=43686 ORGANISM="Pelagodinium beii, Strain RCC1491" /NCGR_SAMPLE_ID=MMETSP1338 /ASSEMBLY_ACC=CAM_ASM_000754 /LENGTH=161 /DNA_ID=CAMNT_0043225661 /DNA_START=74 /DNA_END=560 /DNA_ORIENTATION=+
MSGSIGMDIEASGLGLPPMSLCRTMSEASSADIQTSCLGLPSTLSTSLCRTTSGASSMDISHEDFSPSSGNLAQMPVLFPAGEGGLEGIAFGAAPLRLQQAGIAFLPGESNSIDTRHSKKRPADAETSYTGSCLPSRKKSVLQTLDIRGRYRPVAVEVMEQ